MFEQMESYFQRRSATGLYLSKPSGKGLDIAFQKDKRDIT